MDDEAETYKLWRIRKTVMQVNMTKPLNPNLTWLLNNIRFSVMSRSRLFGNTGRIGPNAWTVQRTIWW